MMLNQQDKVNIVMANQSNDSRQKTENNKFIGGQHENEDGDCWCCYCRCRCHYRRCSHCIWDIYGMFYNWLLLSPATKLLPKISIADMQITSMHASECKVAFGDNIITFNVYQWNVKYRQISPVGSYTYKSLVHTCQLDLVLKKLRDSHFTLIFFQFHFSRWL